MVLRKLERSNHGRKSPVSIKYENLHSFKERVILLCQSILETRRTSRLPGSAFYNSFKCIFKWYPWRADETADKQENFKTICFHHLELFRKKLEANNTKCCNVFENYTSGTVKVSEILFLL